MPRSSENWVRDTVWGPKLLTIAKVGVRVLNGTLIFPDLVEIRQKNGLPCNGAWSMENGAWTLDGMKDELTDYLKLTREIHHSYYMLLISKRVREILTNYMK